MTASPSSDHPSFPGDPDRAIAALTRAPEAVCVQALLPEARSDAATAERVRALARRIAGGLRSRSRDGGRSGLVQGLLQEFALSSQEGVALMCLAEALLRIPDAATRDALIRDKIARGNWQDHLGRSPSLFVNAAAWGLLLTGRLVATHSDDGLSATLRRALARGGEPLIRKGVDMAMRMMGEQFVTGETIEEALQRARPREAQGFRYSYDMLGEAALTAVDAQRYAQAYARAIEAIGLASAGRGVVEGPGISIKLSALHPRYQRAQRERVHEELYPRLLELARQARGHDIGLNIDAEEADRLALSLELLERLCGEPSLAGWQGLGFVIQAYQKRCPAVIDRLVGLARRHGRRLMVRLVKGAYWDSEIKRAQIDGHADYPVYTRKVHTDVAYLACARRLLAAPDAVFPQFATHNAQTLAAVHEMALAVDAPCEFQCLHGMGEPLYEQVVRPPSEGGLGRACRIYAPVGTHDTLLAYLVRRLLENGANSSFVHRVADEAVPLDELVADPVLAVTGEAGRPGTGGLPHPRVPLPAAILGASRRAAPGLDLADEATLQDLARALEASGRAQAPVVPPRVTAAAAGPAAPPVRQVVNPADDQDCVGEIRDTTPAELEAALEAAGRAAPAWAAVAPVRRAEILEQAADRLEAARDELLPLLVREAGKTWPNAVAEWREAIDFLRYDAAELRAGFDAATHRPLGLVASISPWNFPLAIFVGQLAAALAAGNVVLAKPAEQTPLVAVRAVALLHEAGVPSDVLQCLPGPGERVGAALVADPRVQAVLFTGSNEVAGLLQRELAGRLTASGQPVPLIAETGGLNALIVDSSALAEQAVADIVTSAFDSAGQRCSALRLLCVQEDVADRVIEMIEGSLRECRVGDPAQLSTDVGPVIDEAARAAIERHVDAMAARGCRISRPSPMAHVPAGGHFVAPTLIELQRVEDLAREVFGPVLHVVRYRREALAEVLRAVHDSGFGLTQGVHTRIDEVVAQVVAATRAGNLYVNRNIVGAVVGVQPFGGDGLSGTGPKAGGPLYLLRLLAACPPSAARDAVQRQGPERAAAASLAAPVRDGGEVRSSLPLLVDWAQARGPAAQAAVEAVSRAALQVPVCSWRILGGPTGQLDAYAVLPREAVLCLADDDDDRLVQLAAVLAVGSQAVFPSTVRPWVDALPAAVREHVRLAEDWRSPIAPFDAVLHHGRREARLAIAQALAERPGPILGLTALDPGDTAVPLHRLVVERSVSINTAAAGGNASLMTLDDGSGSVHGA